MPRLPKEVLDKIQEAAEDIEFGKITIYLVEHSDSIDIEVDKRIRVKKHPIRPGMVVNGLPKQGA